MSEQDWKARNNERALETIKYGDRGRALSALSECLKFWREQADG